MSLTESTSSENYGLQNITLRPYQIEGVEWYVKCIRNSHGGVLADEMGLGKTIQTICAIIRFKNLFKFNKFIVISPLSVINNWKTELTKFAPNLKYIVYMGDKNIRDAIRSTTDWNSNNIILLTTYEYLINDYDMINPLNIDVLFMDEGHRIKNNDAVLYKKVIEITVKYRFLLTGTPIQNNLDELYNILYVVSPQHPMLANRSVFKRNLGSKLSTMVADSMFDCILQSDSDLNQLILRRTKANVLQHLPDKMEVLIFHGLTDLQKKLYKSFLTREKGIFLDSENGGTSESKSENKKLLNILMQIRKCVLHPYLFSGIEKEPFQIGEHIVENSVKLQAIDKLLKYLIPLGHKILLFSQMTKMLDIIQDFCFFRGYEYERLDGSVRCEERFAAITKFTESESTKLFLLSTRAGGQGINLTAADTVIFVDSDFNPQVDLQAMARIHRPGQQRPCRTIRLVAKHSVEEMIISRAQTKLVMTRSILGHEDGKENGAPMKVKEMLCYGLDKLFSDDSNASNDNLSNEFFTSILGTTDDSGRWQTPATQISQPEVENVANLDHIYLFEGCNYKAKTDKKDYKMAVDLVALDNVGITSDDKETKRNARPKLAAKSYEERKDTVGKARERKKHLWEENDYESCNVMIDSDPEEDGVSVALSTDSQDMSINYVVGDVTQPCGDITKPKIVCQLIDNSGCWGSGGVFSSIDRINPDIAIKYMRAAEMDDISMGDCHIFPFAGSVEVALLVAQSRDNNGRLSPVRMNSLEKCMKTVQKYAQKNNASVHLPRLGYKTPQFNWYGVEKLISKHLAEKGIEAFIYYYRRNNKRPSSPSASDCQRNNVKRIKNTKSNKLILTGPRCDGLFLALSEEYFSDQLNGVVVYFDEGVDNKLRTELSRHILALSGDVSDMFADDRVTHHVVDETKPPVKEKEVSECVSVKVEWLVACIRQKSRVPEDNFLC